MKKAAKKPTAFPLPDDVKDLPLELRGAPATKPPVGLTFKQKKKDLKRADELMALHGTAARLSAEEQALNQARISSPLYRQELDRLLDLAEVPTRKRGFNKAELHRRVKATVHNLADALVEQGLLDQAHGILASLDPKSPQLRDILERRRAIALDDDDHCEHPEKFVRKRIYVPDLGDWVDWIACASCPHTNATRTAPADLAALHRARAEAPKDASDETITTMVRKQLKDG